MDSMDLVVIGIYWDYYHWQAIHLMHDNWDLIRGVGAALVFYASVAINI